MKWTVTTKGEESTLRLATLVGRNAKAHQVILLEGNLGAGKTVFAKGLAKGLRVTETVNSPTFNIVKGYFKGKIPFFHIDAYRLEGNKTDIGLDEYIDGDGICAIEWPGYIDYLIPKEYLKVNIKRVDDNTRSLNFEAIGAQSEMLLEGVKNRWDVF